MYLSICIYGPTGKPAPLLKRKGDKSHKMYWFALPATSVKQQVFCSPHAPKFENILKPKFLLFFIYRHLKTFKSKLFLLSLSVGS